MAHLLFNVAKDKESQKASKGKNDVYTAVANTLAVDRDREVVVPRGVELENFMKNPVMLHIHNYGHVSVGKVLDVRVEDELIEFDFVFADTEEGKQLKDLYDDGFMSAFSVGFYIKGITDMPQPDEDGKLPKTLEVPVTEGTYKIDLSRYKDRAPRAFINKWELLEISPVPVPSNPEAILRRSAGSMVRKFLDSGKSKSAGKILESRLDSLIKDINSKIKSLEDEDTFGAISNVIPVNEEKTFTEKEWDAFVEPSKIAAWASSDGTGAKETMDWGKFADAFAWVDVEKSDRITSYKFLHHTIEDGELVISRSGVYHAMSLFLKSKPKNMSDEDQKGVYEHLSSHYELWKEVAPELRFDYTEDQLVKIQKGEDLETEENPSEEGADVKDDVKDVDITQVEKTIAKGFESLIQTLSEFEASLSVRLGILNDVIKEQHASLEELIKSSSEADINTPDDTDDVKDIDDETTDLIKRLSDNIKKAGVGLDS